MRIGHGYDVHRLVEGRDLILGGVKIPYEKGLLGHSDADVLLHAVSDALLGAAGLGDIGRHFPDTDPQYKGADSLELLRQVYRKISEKGYKVGNIDVTMIAQKPKLKDYIPQKSHMNSMPFRQLKSFLKILIGVQYEKRRRGDPAPFCRNTKIASGSYTGSGREWECEYIIFRSGL